MIARATAEETKLSRLVARVRLSNGYDATSAPLYLQSVTNAIAPLSIPQELKDKIYALIAGCNEVFAVIRFGLLQLKTARDMTRLKTTTDATVQSVLKSIKRLLTQTFPSLVGQSISELQQSAASGKGIFKESAGDVINAGVKVAEFIVTVSTLAQDIMQNAAHMLSLEFSPLELDSHSLAMFTSLMTDSFEVAYRVATDKEHQCNSRKDTNCKDTN